MKRVLSIRKGVLALLLALSLGMGTAYAYNFSAICSTGQTLYYNITDATNHYVEITCPGSSSWSGYTQPTGNIELPSYVTHNGVTYTVTAIGYKAFFNCSGLTGSLTIPNTVTSIGHLAFQGCSGFHGSLTFGTGVTSIGMSAFYGCTHFSGSLTIPDSVTEIQNSTFWSCSGFTGSLIIPNSVTSIGATAFQDCTGFTGSLTFGTGVTSIDNGAFYRCTGFTSIKAFPETPPTLGTTVFYNVPTTIPVFVPCGLLQAYQNAPGWSSFSNLVESCPQQLTVNNGPEDNNYIPVFGWFCDHYSKSQFIIPASDLQTMQQSIITKLTFYALNTNVSWGDARFDVYLAEVEETSFGSTTLDWTGMTKVLENASLSVANNKMEVVLSLPYLYQGGNLKVGIKQVVSGNNVTSKWYGVSKNSTVAIGGYEETRGLGFYQFLPKTTFDYFSAPQTSIEFADPQVKNICVANWDTNHDGELSYDEAAAVTELGTVFGETSITSFDELQYFTGLSYILDEAFFSCEQLTSVIIPSGVGTIYNNAFTGCSSLTSIIIPSSVHNIHDNPFMSCPALANIVVEAGNTVYDSRDNCNAIIVTATNTLKTGCINTVIPNNIEAIGIGAFWGCTGLTSIAIPNSVTIIGGGAFRFCSSLELFVFPNSVTYIGNVVFEDCTSLTSLTVPAATPPSLETNTFYGISTGIPVYVPCGSLAAYQAAAGWSNFTNIQCDLGNIVFVDPAVKAICVDNWDANGDGELSYAEAAAVTSLIPEGETNSAFYQNTSITSFNELQYFTGLEVINNEAFYHCRNLTQVTFPNSVIAIMHRAFSGCHNLTSVTIPNSVIFIGQTAFGSCNLTSIVIPSSVTAIDDNPFSACSSLAQISVDEGNQEYSSPNNCNAIIETGTNTLVAGCKNTVIPEGVTTIACAAFNYCNDLTGINIPSSVTRIGESAFRHCTGLSTLTIPSAVNYIGVNAFLYCTGLTEITVLATTPPELDGYVFSTDMLNIPVYVPCESLAAYQTYDNGQPWGGFTNIQCIVCSAELPLSENFDSYPGVTSGSENVLPDCWSRINTTTVSSQQGYPTIFQGSYAQSAPNFLYFMSTYAVGYFEDPQDQYAILPSIDNVSDLVLSLYARIPAEGRNATFMVGVMTDPEDASTFTELATYQPSSYTYTQYTIPFNNYTGNGQYIAIKMPAASSSVNYRGLAIDDLTLDIVSSPNIVFADANVKAICVDNWDTNGDGELSYDEAAAVMTLKPSGAENSVFWNTEITSFDELQYFTGLTSIEENAFMFCNSLTSVTLPNAVTSIGSYAFAYCISLTSVSLPNSLTTIGDFAFTNATSLSAIELPLSLMDIGMMAFDNCGLVSVVIPASVMGIGINPFTYCSSLTSITVDGPSNVFYTPNDNALVNSQTQTLVTGLSTTIIPNTVTTIGAFAFDGCINLTSITIPNSVTYIDNLAFHYCIGLTSITVEATTPPTLGNDVFQAIPVDIPVYVPCESLDAYQDYNNTGSPWGGFTNIKTLNEHFPWTEDFENYAGLNNNNTNYNTMPSCWSSIHGANPAQNYYDRYPSVYTYSNYAHSGSNFIFFADNYNTDYTHSDQYAILPSVENVNQMTLSLYALKEYRTAYFEVGVMTDPDDASTFTMVGSATATTTHTLYSFSFANYTGTGTYIAIRMPKATNGNNRGVCIDDVTLDHVITFADPAVKAICVQNWDTNGDGELSYIEAAAVTSLGQVFQNAFQEEGTNVTFNELQYFTGLTSIGANAFAGCWRLTSVTLPPTVTTIGSNAFTMCSGLASSPITNHVTEIGDYAFNYCYSLTEIELPSSVTSIGNRAFDRCYYLTSVVIPASVTSIGINPFSGCTRLASIVVDEGNTVYGSPNGCNAIINTEEHLLVSGCNNTNIPDGVQTIGWYAFLASGLTTLTIPTSVNSIADYAFSECEALSELTLLATTPPTLEGTDVFSYINLDIPVYVPCESLEAYQTYNNGQPWGGFTNIRCDVCTAELPLSENFDSYQGTTSGATNVLPDCWDRINTAVDIAYTGYPTILNEPANAYSGSNYLRFHYNQGYGSEQYVILPYVDDIAEVSLWFYAKALTENAAIFVGVMTDPNDVSTFETAFEIDNLTSDYQQCNVSIDPEYINDQTHYIAIKSGANNGATQCDLCIDNLELLRITQQNLTLAEGWNWWTPTVRTYRSALQYALGSNGIIINSQDQGFQKNNGNYWSGTLPGVLEPGQMYKIKTNAAVSATLQGLEVAQPTITIVAGYNWFGYAGAQAADIATAIDILGVSPTDGDTITDKNGNTATYNGSSWSGNLTTLQPGHGYVYRRQ